MIKIALFHLAAMPLGGRVSYTYYMAESLAAQGFSPEIYEIKAKDEKRARPFAGEWLYHNVTLKTAIQIARQTPTLITALDKRLLDKGLELFRQGVALTIHRSGELSRRTIALFRELGVQIVTPCEQLAHRLRGEQVQAHFIPYPYPYAALPDRPKKIRAMSVSRLERNRGFETIFKINACFRDAGLPEKVIQAYGDENRIFTHKEIASRVPDWRDLGYNGTFEPGTGASVLADAQYMIDLRETSSTTWHYSVLEALAAGAVPILRQPLNKLLSGIGLENVAVLHTGDEKSLAKLIDEGDDSFPLDVREMALASHLPTVIIPSYIQALRIK